MTKITRPEAMFNSLKPDEQQVLWGKLDRLLDFDFDSAKIVILVIDSDAVESRDWDSIEVLCWTDRQGSDESISEPLSVDEVEWLAKHIGEDEAAVMKRDFGMKGKQTAVLYCVTYSEDEEEEPVMKEYSCLTRDVEPDEEDD